MGASIWDLVKAPVVLVKYKLVTKLSGGQRRLFLANSLGRGARSEKEENMDRTVSLPNEPDKTATGNRNLLD